MTVGKFEAVYQESFRGEYNVFLPDGYGIHKQLYPLLVYLHGYMENTSLQISWKKIFPTA